MEELVMITNEEMKSALSEFKEGLDVIDAELRDVKARLSRLYDALETGKLSLDDLSPRIKELRSRQDELSKARLQLEAEKITGGIKHVDVDPIKAYAEEMRTTLEEADVVESKAFLRSFIERIEINKNNGLIRYRPPMPQGDQTQTVVLPMVTPGGHWGTVPELLFEKKGLIPALQQLLTSCPIEV